MSALSTPPPWRRHFPISKEAEKNWESLENGESLLLYGLQNNLIARKDYFAWAVKHYQIPFVQTEYFQDLPSIGAEVKDQEKWSPEFAPLCVWEGIVFIGCLERRKGPSFPHRLALATDISLSTAYKSLFQDSASFSSDGFEETSVLSAVSALAQKPEAKKNPPPPLAPPSSQKALESVRKNTSDALKAAQKPSGEEEKTSVLKDFKKEEAAPSSAVEEDLTCKTVIKFHKKKSRLEDIQPQMRKYFLGMALMIKEGSLLKLKESVGVMIKNKDWTADTQSTNFFKVISKGLPYHGPVISGPEESAVLKSLGFDVLPRHISVVCAHSEEKSLVFFGAGIKKISFPKVEELHAFITDFLNSKHSGASQKAA